jgi:two-component system chemotaxis response regulator CheY
MLKTLVVDDSRIMRMMVMKGLREAALGEFDFVEAEDGAQALEKFNAGGIDIAFVDWNMPNMTGIDFVLAVRRAGHEDVPLVMVTSERTMSKMEKALDEAGANAYICKPFTAEELRQKLEKVIEQAEERKSSAGQGLFGGSRSTLRTWETQQVSCPMSSVATSSPSWRPNGSRRKCPCRWWLAAATSR